MYASCQASWQYFDIGLCDYSVGVQQLFFYLESHQFPHKILVCTLMKFLIRRKRKLVFNSWFKTTCDKLHTSDKAFNFSSKNKIETFWKSKLHENCAAYDLLIYFFAPLSLLVFQVVFLLELSYVYLLKWKPNLHNISRNYMVFMHIYSVNVIKILIGNVIKFNFVLFYGFSARQQPN